MSQQRRATRSRSAEVDVEAFIAALEHPHEDAIRELRSLILAASPDIREDIKWNAPSFRTSEHFATFNLVGKEGVRVVLHFGSTSRLDIEVRSRIEDSAGLLDWKSPDRALMNFRDVADVREAGAALTALIQQWIRFIPE